MCLTESAILFCFHSIRMSFLILSHVVIALLTFRTCQCNSCAHDFHLHLISRFCYWVFVCLILSIKKRPKLFHSPVYYIIKHLIRQYISYFFHQRSFTTISCRQMKRKFYLLAVGDGTFDSVRRLITIFIYLANPLIRCVHIRSLTHSILINISSVHYFIFYHDTIFSHIIMIINPTGFSHSTIRCKIVPFLAKLQPFI